MALTITIPGAVEATIGATAPAVLTIGVGTPGATGPAGAAGPGVPVGGTAGQFLTKIDSTNYNTDWTTVNLSVYAVKSNNLSDLASASTARTNLGLGTMATATAANYSTTAAANLLYAPIAAGQPVSGTVGQVLTKNSGTDYDSSWATLIPGDRYLTTSTTSLTIDNANKTLTVGTGLSYTPQQDVVIAYDATHHMHAQVLTYNSGTGVMTVDVRSHTGTGTFAVWTVNVGGTVPAASIVWGDITGVLGNQTDLATALNGKLETTTAASTYQTLAGMSSYLTTATAASTYFTIASAAGKANLSGATFTGKVNLATINVATPSINLGGQCDSAPASAANGDIWISNAAAPKLTYKMGGVNYNLPVLNQFNTFTNQMVIDTTSSATAALRVTQRGAGNAITVEDSTTPDSSSFTVDQFGKVGVGVAPDTTAALKVDTNGIMFGNGTTQITASPPFVFDPVSYRASLVLSGYDRASVIAPDAFIVREPSTNLQTAMTVNGVIFPDDSLQTTAGIGDAPSNGNYYVRKDGAWVQCTVISIYDSNTSTSYNCLTV